jgi:hypothetical protein
MATASCGVSADDASRPSNGAEPATAALTAGGAVLVPVTEAARRGCHDEINATYCSTATLGAAQASCAARLSPRDRQACGRQGRDCLVPFSTTRDATCHEGPTYADLAACHSPVADDCSFYRRCLESSVDCGEDGYPLRFGERLCNMFLRTDDEFSPAGRRWLRAIRRCLQDELVFAVDAPLECNALEDRAYDAHSRCYTDPHHSICDLSLGDRFRLTELLGKELLNARAFEQIQAVVAACL